MPTPEFARTVDIHRKPGYDPVELFFDAATRTIPLDATLVKGSHGLPVLGDDNQAVLLSSDDTLVDTIEVKDLDVAARILTWFAEE